MQCKKHVKKTPSTMAAILGLENTIVEEICGKIDEIVVPANYNCPGQLVISGTFNGIDLALREINRSWSKKSAEITCRRSISFSAYGFCKK